MSSKGILTAVGLSTLLPVLAVSQVNTGAGLTVRSNPSGALVELHGEATVTGVTPTTFRYPFLGSYRLKVSKYGFESYSTHVVLDPTRPLELEVALSPKTRFKAAVRSVFVPGWGQLYAERETRALAFGVLAVGAGVAYLIADHNFDIKFDRYQDRLYTYDSASANGAGYEDLQRFLQSVLHTQDEAYDWEDIRRATIGAAIAVWALSVADALLSSPGEKTTLSVKGISVEPTAKRGRLGLMCSRSF